MLLEGAGFDRVHNLQGGVAAWAEEVEPTMKKY
jgi:rhodanese-related sulfurtransferase